MSFFKIFLALCIFIVSNIFTQSPLNAKEANTQSLMCEVTLSEYDDQLVIAGITGENVTLNIFDENQTLVWSCNHWTGLGCSETETIPLQNGVYYVAIQSSDCDFYESIEINTASETNTDCGFFNTFIVSPSVYSYGSSITENLDGSFQIVNQYKNENDVLLEYGAVIDGMGNLISEAILPATQFKYAFDDQSLKHTFYKTDANGTEIWSNEIQTNLGIVGPEVRSNSSVKIVDNRILYFGATGEWDNNNQAQGTYLFFAELDLEGNLINYFESSNPFPSTSTDKNIHISYFHLADEKAVISFRQRGAYHYAVADLNTNQFTSEHFHNNTISWFVRSALSPDGSKLLLFSNNKEVKLIDLENNTTNNLPDIEVAVSDLLNDFSSTPVFSGASNAILLDNGDFIMSVYTSSPALKFCVRFDANGTLLWSNQFQNMLPYPGNHYYEPAIVTTTGNIIFQHMAYASGKFEILMLSPNGELLNCDENGNVICNIEVSTSSGKIIFGGMVGSGLQTMILDENQEIVWSCITTDEVNCNNITTVDLSAGHYTLHVQSEYCDFEETIYVEEQECSFLESFEYSVPPSFSIPEWEISETVENNFLVSLQHAASSTYNIEIDRNGNDLSTFFSSAESFDYEFDAQNSIHTFSGKDPQGNPWETEVPLQFGTFENITMGIQSGAGFVKKDDQIVSLGVVGKLENDSIVNTQLFFAEFDLNGNLTTYLETPSNYSVPAANQSNIRGMEIHWGGNTVILKYTHWVNSWRYTKIDLNSLQFTTTQYSSGSAMHHNGSWLSPDGSKFFAYDRFEIGDNIVIIDMETGAYLPNNINTMCKPASNFPGQSITWLLNTIYPLRDNGYLAKIDFVLGYSGSRIARFNSDHQMIWCKDFEEFIPEGHRFIPSLESASGNLLFNFSLYNSNEVSVLMTNAYGEFVSCEPVVTEECEVAISTFYNQLRIEGLTGENIDVNVFDSNQDLVWSCNSTSGDECSESHNINLPVGNYVVTVQSSLCDFTETFKLLEDTPSPPKRIGIVPSIYPNPVMDELNIQIQSITNQTCSFQIRNTNGSVIDTQEIELINGFNNFSFPTTNLQLGMYYLILTDGQGMQIAHKFIKAN